VGVKNCRYDKGTGNREQGIGNREQGRGFGQLYFSLLMSVFFRSHIYVKIYLLDNSVLEYFTSFPSNYPQHEYQQPREQIKKQHFP